MTAATTAGMAAATAAAMASAAAAASAAAPSAATRCKPYAGLKIHFSVKNVKSPQANIRHFLLSENDPRSRALRRHLHGGCIR